MILKIIIILILTMAPSYYITMVIWKFKFGEVISVGEEGKKIMIWSYLILSSIVLLIYFLI
jgi:hypothetical protein